MQKILLLTYFEPFGGESINPSGTVADILPGYIGGIKIIKLLLPVHFMKAKEELETAMDKYKPGAVLSLGQAGGRAALSVEKTALNIAEGATYDGEAFSGEPLDAAGADAYFSTFPVKAVSKAVNDAGVPCVVSYFAGTYVCNSVLYAALNKARDTCTKCGFIHLPYLLSQGVFKNVPTMTAESMAKGVEAAIIAVFSDMSDSEDMPADEKLH